MGRIVNASSMVWLFCFVPAVDACDQPSDIEIPHGLSASARDIADAGARTYGYMSSMAVFVSCLEVAIEVEQQNDIPGAGEKDPVSLALARRSAALEKMNATYARFQKAVEDFESRARM